jgi:hypothetical protein
MNSIETQLREAMGGIPPIARPIHVSVTERILRRLLLAILLIAMVGTGAELILLEHTETIWQLIPLGLLASGIIGALAVATRPGRPAIRVFQVLMALFIAAGLTGLFLHYKGNVEFELEMYPTMKGVDLFRESMMGATPALAPGAMIWLGLLGLAFTFRHPQLRSEAR